MENKTGNILGLPPTQAAVVAVVAAGVIIACILHAVWSNHGDAVAFVVLVTACLVNGLNVTLILLRRKLQRQIFRRLGLFARVGSGALLVVLALVGAFGLVLLGGGGNAFGAQLQLMVLGAAIAAILVLNMALI